MMDELRRPILLEPEYRNYVWGGTRLKPPESPVAELWTVYEGDRILTGPLTGRTLGQVAQQYREALLGERSVQKTGGRFPLLIKLLDCAQWLSLQVHPNDEQAVRLEGPGQFGKTEAWYILDAQPEAELLAGLLPGLTHEKLREVVRDGKILDWVERHTVRTGDGVFIPAGTVHALGPGLLVYEVQQTSNITYRVYDWDRPVSEGRALHIEQSLEVIDLDATGEIFHLPELAGRVERMVSCPYFVLDHLSVGPEPLALDTQQESFHCLTGINCDIVIAGNGWQETIHRFQSVVIPAVLGPYSLFAENSCQVLKSAMA